MDRNKIREIEKLVGFATIFSLAIGFIAALAAIVSFFSGDFSTASLCLIAAALGFGLFSVAVLGG